MAKRYPQPFWRAQTNCYYVQVGKKQHRLSPDKEEAYRLYHALMQEPTQPVMVAQKPQSELTVVEVLDEFLEWASKNSSPKTYAWRRNCLQIFTKSIPGTMLVSDLRPLHVPREMNAHPTWGNDTRANFARCAQRAMSWALDQGMIDRNPIAKVEKPGKGRREEVYSREEYDRLIEVFPDQAMRDVLVTVWETGCRPQELFAIEAKFVDLAGKRWVFPIQSSKGKRKPRIVYLSDAAFAVTERLCQENRTGPLFRNRDGERWDKESVGRRFARKKAKLGRRYCLYGFRHSFATRKLIEGVDAISVATLLGHSNLSMLANQYSHLINNKDHLRKALNPRADG